MSQDRVPDMRNSILRFYHRMNIEEGYIELQKRIGYDFRDSAKLIKALSHSSYVNELKLSKHDDYERTEFLGDAVLELTVSEFLYENRPDMREGEMTKLRASLVCEPTLAYCAREGMELGKYLLLGKGEDSSGGRGRDSIVSDVFEAIIGAIYLDGGIDAAKEFIHRFLLTDYEKKIEFVDSKTILQEYAQNHGICLEYELVEERGPEHDRDYVMRAKLGDTISETGCAKSKKAAQQNAAYAILKKHVNKTEMQ